MAPVPGWAAPYIGLPYADKGRSRAGADCWGGVRGAKRVATQAPEAAPESSPSNRLNTSQATDGQTPVAFSTSEVQAADGKTARAAVRDQARTRFAEKTFTSADGHDIIVPWQGIKHGTERAAKPGLAAALHLDDLIRSSRRTASAPDRQQRQDIRAVHTFETKANIDGKPHRVTLFVREHKDGKRYYDHALIKDEPPGVPGAATSKSQAAHQPAGGSEAKDTTATPAAAQPAVAKRQQIADARNAEKTAYTTLANKPELVGKSLKDIEAALKEATAEHPLVNPARIAKMAKALHAELARNAKELAKQQHRDPAVHARALGDAVAKAYTDGEPPTSEQRGGFSVGWSHALKGKTKSTLSGDDLADKLRGYEGARAWMKTDEGAAWYEGRPAKKLENTGADLRRAWEQRKAELASKETDAGKLWRHMKSKTERADLFPIDPAADATPGVGRIMEEVRHQIATFPQYLSRWAHGAPLVRGPEGTDARTYPGIDLGTRGRYSGGSVDNRIQSFIDRLVGDNREFRYALDPDGKPIEGKDYLGRPTQQPARREVTQDEARDMLLDVARQYMDDVRELHDALAATKNGNEALAAVEAFRERTKEGDDTATRLRPSGRGRAAYTFLHTDKYSKLAAIAEHYDDTARATPNKKTPLVAPKLDRVTREGLPDRRHGKDVTPQQVKDTFGFADIGFGKWVGSKQDQDHLNYAYDAFHDLAEHFGIPPKMVGLGGKLHLTIGALGHGKASAHFQAEQPHPNGGTVPVINLTNTRGDGTVYHEWMHAFDMVGAQGDWPKVRARIQNVFTEKQETVESVEAAARRFLIGGSYWKGNKRMDRVVAAVRMMDDRTFARWGTASTEYKRGADKLGADYWGNSKELLARATEAWAADTLKGTDTYLVNPAWVGGGAVTPAKGYRGTPYPAGDERRLFNDALTALAKATTAKDGGLHVSLEAFDKAFPDPAEAGKRRRLDLQKRENMETYFDELTDQIDAKNAAEAQAELEAERAEQARMDEMAEQAAAELAPPTDAETQGPLSRDDISDIFDQALAELTEEQAHDNRGNDNTEALRAPEPPASTQGEAAPAPNSAADQKTAAAIAADAAKLGVKGLDEAMQGLVKLFGAAPGRLNSFPSGFDKEAYAAAKPHFEAALKAFQASGKSLKDLFKFLIAKFNPGIKDYLVQFAQDKGLDATLGDSRAAASEADPLQRSPSRVLADWVAARLHQDGDMDSRELFRAANDAFGGTQGEAKYTPKDAYDAMEAGVNRYIAARPDVFTPQAGVDGAAAAVAALERLTARLPTQTKRTAEQDEFQQFSTVPALAYVANWAARVSGEDTLLEPSAGVGGLAVFGKNAGAHLVLNELSSRRAAVLRDVFPSARVFTENAEQIDNVLPPEIAPTVVVMNPPFSASAGRVEGKRDTMIGAQHVEQALARLAPGGRLVAIVGRGMGMDEARFKPWWKKIQDRYDVRAAIPIDGKGFAKYGTTFDNALLVIDKVKPVDGRQVLTTPAKAYTDLVGPLAEIRNDRPTPIASADTAALERAAAEQARDRVDAEGGSTDAGTAGAVGVAGVGGAEPGRGGLGTEPAGAGGGHRTGRSGGTVSSVRGRGGRHHAGQDTGTGGDRTAVAGAGSAAGELGQSGLTYEAADKTAGELTDSTFEPYRPQRLEIPGARPHPGQLVESSAMASVMPPKPTYQPNLPPETVKGFALDPKRPNLLDGGLSLAQLEPVIAAGQAHAEVLPNGTRRGYFIGDGTGVGKGREISGIMLDNLRQGRDKAVWISEKQGLFKDAQRDFKGAGGDDSLLFQHIKTPLTVTDAQGNQSAGEIKNEKGVLFSTYSALHMKSKLTDAQKNMNIEPVSRVDQIAKWLGPDFDGVIAFDEAHNAGNAGLGAGKGSGGKGASKQALAVLELQKKLPNARVLLVSATGATELSNLGYAERLGLWGKGTPFPDAKAFMAKMEEGGLASMELVARDMKQMGVYLARSLSYDGVTYDRLEHELSPTQSAIYDRIADGWQVVLQNMEKALELTGARTPDGKTADPAAVSNARNAFWSEQLRFFSHLLTSLQMPSLIERVERDLANGDAPVLQLVNTAEAALTRALAKSEAAGEVPALDELDLSPKQRLIQMVEHSFPVQQMEEVTDASGKPVMQAVVDSQGNPVLNREAVAMRDKLLKDLQDIPVPEGALDQIVKHFGPEQVAEVTGRGQRVVHEMQDGERKAVLQKRSPKMAAQDMRDFQADKKRIMVFSDAGGTGYSFHADRSNKNQRRRQHYMVQPGWRADKAVQAFGRTHRTNEASQPNYVLVSTNVPAHARFMATVARRLDQLGALTKGQRDTASQGMFSEKDNIENIYATRAVQSLMKDVEAGRLPGIQRDDLLKQMGLQDIVDDKTRQISENKMPETRKFLNRMLSLKLDLQRKVFDAFRERMDDEVEAAAANGTLDTGMQTIKATESHVTNEDTLYTDPRTGAETKLASLDVVNPNTFHAFPEAHRYEQAEWLQNNGSGKVWLKARRGSETLKDGSVVDRYALFGTNGKTYKNARSFRSEAYTPIDEAKARALWEAENTKRPPTVTRPLHMVTGLSLPIWDRLPEKASVGRIQTTEGRRLVGRIVVPNELPELRKRFSLSSPAAKLAPHELLARVLKGDTAELANGWKLERARVADELRVELKTQGGWMSPAAVKELTDLGVIQERIDWKDRYFVPTGAKGAEVAKALFATKPVFDLTGKDEPAFSRRGETAAPPRSQGLPETVETPVARFRNDQSLKRDPGYAAAKAGDAPAAARLVKRLAGPLVARARARFGDGAIYVAPHAEEATGKNAIPHTLAEALAGESSGSVDDSIVQTNRVHHTGAGIMQRLIARPQFDGDVKPGGRYVLVDDVTTSGGTFADLADYIRSKGGDVVGAVSLVNAARSGRLAPEPHVVRRLEGRHGDVIREQFGIEPRALTAEEANYLTGFRSADEIRNRAASAAQERSGRLRAKGVQGLESSPAAAVGGKPDAALTGSGVPQGLPTKATPAALSLERGLDKYFGLDSRHGTRIREIPVHALPDALRRALAHFEKLTGTKVHVVRNLTPEIQQFNGVTLRDGHLYVDETSQAPVTTTAAHEFTHQLRKNAPELYGQLEAEVRRQGRLDAWQAKLQQEAGAKTRITRDIANEELTANAVGDAMADPAFLEQMAKRNPLAFGTLARRFIDFINQFLGRARDLGSNKYLQDVAAFRDKLADVLDTYAKGEGRGDEAGAPAFDRQAETFYSALTKSVDEAKGAPKKATGEQWKQWLDGAQRRGEFKGAEREWMGVDQWLGDQKGPVTREQLADFVRGNHVQVREVMHGDEPPINAEDIRENEDGGFDLVDDAGALATAPERPTKFGAYTLPGGKSYRELLLTLPRKPTSDQLYDQQNALSDALHRKYGDGWRNKATPEELARDAQLGRAAEDAAGKPQNFKSGHFDEPNILAHVRFNDRTGPDGEKILHVEEVQSDWHQAGRKVGYAHAITEAGRTELQRLRAADEAGRPLSSAEQERMLRLEDLSDPSRSEGVVPDAPFKKEWPMLAMKRVLRYAADHGYDKVTWTTGEQQAARYDLSKRIGSIHAARLSDGDYAISAYGKRDAEIPGMRNRRVKEKDLPNVVGKEMAEKIVRDEGGRIDPRTGARVYSGLDLKLGGEGMHAFYDKLLPNELNKYAKQWGAKVGETTIDTDDGNMLRNRYTYVGPTLDAAEVRAAVEGTRDGPADIRRQLNAVARAMNEGVAFEDAMEHNASEMAARLLGGKMVRRDGLPETVHSLDITPEMRESVQQGQPMFARKVDDDGPHGPVFETHDYRTAVDTLLREKNGEVKGALFNPTSGPVDLVYGKAGTAAKGYRDGYGLAKILAKHPDVDIHALAGELLSAKASAPHGNTWQFEGDRYRIVLKRDWLGDRKTWLLTAFTPKERPATGSTRIGAAAIREGEARSPEVTGADSVPRTNDAVKSPDGPAFSRRDDQPSDPAKEPRAVTKDIEAVLQHGDPSGVMDKAKAWLRGKYEDLRPAMLGALQTRHLLELMDDVPSLRGMSRTYGDSMRQMDADRQQLMVGAADADKHPTDMLKKGAVNIAQELRKFAYGRSLRGTPKPEAKRLFDLMHQATIQRLDPDKVYERLTIENAHGDAVPWTHEEVKARLKLLRTLAMQRGGDYPADRENLRDEVKYLRNLPKMERTRERNWPKLQAAWQALPEEAKNLYRQVRDWYSQHRDATEEALIKNIEAMDLPETYRRSLVNRMRLRFEEARREGVYFPLNRDGDYWIAFRDKEGNEGFKMFESAREYAAGEKRLRAAGFQIDAKGRRDNNMRAKDAPSGTFVREVIDTLQKAHVSETIQDQVYQTFLRSLPEMSMRKHAIHRRNIAGFSQDALRTFAKNGFHGAHQLARLRHAQDMQLALEAMRMSVDNWRRGENSTDTMKEPPPLDVAKADALVGEMQKRHDWIMQPTDQKLANMVNSLGFIYYLGASPASALTNLTQVVQTSLPVLGAEHGWPKATAALGAAWRDAARTGGHMERTFKDPEDKRAFLVMQQRGDFSKTQAHTLAGLAEGNVLQSSPAWSRVMGVVSWMFHKSELINREATGMAAYRLARAKGKTFDQAIAYASDNLATTNFDYSAANRPRYMQGNVQRIALQFKNYSIGMTWLFYRNLYQSMKGETPEVRRVAKRTVTGVLGMTALLAGATGLPVYNSVRMAANAANTLWGDDNEPWNFDDAFHRWLADNLGPDAARLIAEGPTNYFTGANLASRTSMANLWIHDDDQRLEGADAYHALLESLAGPIGGITNNFYVGIEDVRRGKMERGIERMLPTSAKNAIKALRYAHEGVNSMRGDPIVPDVSGYEDFLQAIGLQPAAVANQYRINDAMKNYTSQVQNRRINVMNGYAMALKNGDADDRSAALGAINRFNAAHPEVAITARTLTASLRQRARLSAQATNGVLLNRKLALQAQAYAGTNAAVTAPAH